MKKFFTLKFLMVVLVLCTGSKMSFAQSIFTNPIIGTNPNTSNPYTTGQIIDPNITVSGIGRGTGINGSNANDRYNANNWNSPTIDLTDFFEFTITPRSGAKIDFASFVYTSQTSMTGPVNFAFRSSIDGFTTNIAAPPVTGTTIILSAAAFQGITSSITFRIYGWGASGSGGTFSVNDITFNGSVSPLTAQYYRTKTSGDWNDVNTWEFSADNTNWFNSTLVPSSFEKNITIQAPHNVTVSNPTSLDEATIQGTLQVFNGGVLKINDGAGTDVDISNNGVLQILCTAVYSYSSTIILTGSPVINVATGGKIQIGDGTIAVGPGYEAFATSGANIWNNASIFEWNSPVNLPFSNTTFFPNAGSSVIPNLKISAVSSPIGGGSAVFLNGLLEAGTNFSFGSGGNKTIRDGICGNSTLSIPASVGTIYIDGIAPIFGGTNLVIATDKNINIPNGVTVPTDSIVKVSPLTSTTPQFAKGSNVNFTVNGTIDFTTVTVTNTTGAVIINGYVKTAHSGGLEGGTISNNSATQVNFGSTIEYNAASGFQVITASTSLEGTSPYYNLILSGGGNKTPGGAISVNTTGSVTITGASTVVDATNHNIGLTSSNTTSFTIDAGRLILGTTGFPLPLMDGTYNISGGVIQYTASVATTQTIRSKTYYAIEVTGTNVGNSSGNITLASGGSFTVKGTGTFMINSDAIIGPTGIQTVTVESGGLFKCGTNQGFHGFISTALPPNYSAIHQNIENIVLKPGSIVEYTRAGDQPITNVNGLIYQTLVLSGSGNKMAPANTLAVQGQLLTSGTPTFLHNNGTVLLDGTGTQNFAGLTYNNLILTGSSKNTSGTSTIIDSIKVNASATLSISNGDTIILHSDAARTARVGQLNGNIGYNSGGLFVVERYISSKRAWRFLSTATYSPFKSIKNQWQEGAVDINNDPKPGYGTQITDNNNASWAANGFDSYSQNGPSMKYYDPATDTYIGILSTLAPFDASLGGYMTFIRGDRSAKVFGSPVTNTVLRTAGSLFSGNQPDIVAKTGKFIPVNNPYASSIDLRKISTSVNVFYYIWDPNRTGGAFGLGAFQTLSWNGTNYSVIPGSGSYGATNNFVESGQAFFVGTLGADTAMKLTENAKSDATFSIAPFTPTGNPGQQLRTNLYAVNADGSTSIVDGVLSNFSDTYNNGIDGMDARKLTNFGENLAIQSHNHSLVVERRRTIYSNDTLVYKLYRLRATQYKLEFIAGQLNNTGLDAYLEDDYLKTRTPINLNGNTEADFTVDNNAGSAAANRFRMVFEAAAGPLPVTFTSIKAHLENDDIAVKWYVENETGIKQYEIERSVDGISFAYGATVAAQNSPQSNYTWLDISPAAGYHYYRIKSIGLNGKIQYSKIVRVIISVRKQEITIYPNPIKNGIIHLQLINQPEGTYSIRVINKPGQLVVSKQIDHSFNSGVEKIDISLNAPRGIYNVEIIKPDNSKEIKKIVY